MSRIFLSHSSIDEREAVALTHCLAEFLLAKNLGKLIFGVVIDDVPLGELPTEMTSEWQLCHFVGSGPIETVCFTHRETADEVIFQADGLKRLKDGLQRAGINAEYFPWPPQDDPNRAPYRGLEPLDACDAAIFFGCGVEILRGLNVLREMRYSGEKKLFIILGASGAGKSSLAPHLSIPPPLQRLEHLIAG